jgi:hypothetical protein
MTMAYITRIIQVISAKELKAITTLIMTMSIKIYPMVHSKFGLLEEISEILLTTVIHLSGTISIIIYGKDFVIFMAAD